MFIKSKLNPLERFHPIQNRDKKEMTSLDLGFEWFELINVVNRELLYCPHDDVLRGKRLRKGEPVDFSWKYTLNALGAEQAHRQFGHASDLKAL